VKHRVRARITQPIAEQDGTVLMQPGTLLAPDDDLLAGLPPGHHAMVVESVEDDADWPDEVKKDDGKKDPGPQKPDDMPPRPAQARAK
jgi:hypothetical protein